MPNKEFLILKHWKNNEKKLFEDNECRRIAPQSMQSSASFKGLNIFCVSDTTNKHNRYHEQEAAAGQRG